MACYYVTGARGSGKSLFAVHRIKEYLQQGRKVATNLDITPQGILDNIYYLTRLPCKPSAKHFLDLGYAYDLKKPSDYDESKNGLIVLDEISLFLSTKKDKEFQELMEWLVQSRKYGWDLILVAQTKEQVHETVYKALCDNLVLCKADKLVPIPYIGKLLRMIGLSGKLPDNHTALILNGRSEQNDIVERVSYNRKELQGFYNTAQTFNDGHEFINGQLVDMRASYTVVPDYILSGQKIIDGFNEKINVLKEKLSKADKQQEGDKMAVNHHKSTANYMKIGLLVLGLVVFMIFNNPMDNPMLSGDDSITDASLPVETEQSINPEPVINKQPDYSTIKNDIEISTGDYFKDMIRGAEVTIPIYSDDSGLNALVQVSTETKRQFISLADLRVLGWYAIKGENVIFLKKDKTTINIPLSYRTYDVKNNQ